MVPHSIRIVCKFELFGTTTSFQKISNKNTFIMNKVGLVGLFAIYLFLFFINSIECAPISSDDTTTVESPSSADDSEYSSIDELCEILSYFGECMDQFS